MTVHVFENDRDGKPVDLGADFGEGGDPAEVVPVAGDAGGAGGARLLLHDEGAFGAGLAAGEFLGGDAVFEANEFADQDIEGFLGALGGGSGVAEDAGLVFEGVGGGVDGVTEAALFANFGEEAGAHAAGEDVDGGPGGVVLGVVVGDAVVGDADLGLGGLVREVIDLRAGRSGLDDGIGFGLPVTEEAADEVDQFLRVDIPGDGEDGAVGADAAGGVRADGVGGERGDGVEAAFVGEAPRGGVTASLEFLHHLLAGFVFEAAEGLFDADAGGLELVFGEVGPLKHVGVEGEGFGQFLGEGGSGEGDVDGGGAFAAGEAEVIEGGGEFAAVEGPGAAEHPVGEDGGGSAGGGCVEGTAGGDEERERGRADIRHRFDEQGESVGVGVRAESSDGGHPETS